MMLCSGNLSGLCAPRSDRCRAEAVREERVRTGRAPLQTPRAGVFASARGLLMFPHCSGYSVTPKGSQEDHSKNSDSRPSIGWKKFQCPCDARIFRSHCAICQSQRRNKQQQHATRLTSRHRRWPLSPLSSPLSAPRARRDERTSPPKAQARLGYDTARFDCLLCHAAEGWSAAQATGSRYFSAGGRGRGTRGSL